MENTEKKPKRRLTPRPPSMLDAFIPLTFLIVSLACAIFLYGGDSIAGPVLKNSVVVRSRQPGRKNVLTRLFTCSHFKS